MAPLGTLVVQCSVKQRTFKRYGTKYRHCAMTYANLHWPYPAIHPTTCAVQRKLDQCLRGKDRNGIGYVAVTVQIVELPGLCYRLMRRGMGIFCEQFVIFSRFLVNDTYLTIYLHCTLSICIHKCTDISVYERYLAHNIPEGCTTSGHVE